MVDCSYQISPSIDLKGLISEIEKLKTQQRDKSVKQTVSYVSEYPNCPKKESIYNTNGRRTNHIHDNTLQDQEPALQFRKGHKSNSIKNQKKMFQKRNTTNVSSITHRTKMILGDQFSNSVFALFENNHINKVNRRNKIKSPIRSYTPSIFNSLTSEKAKYYQRSDKQDFSQRNQPLPNIKNTPLKIQETKPILVKFTRKHKRKRLFSDVVTSTEDFL